MFPPIITRLIIRDIICATLLALLAVTGLMMILGAIFEGGKIGLDPWSLITYVPYLITPSLPYTIPAALLFGCTYVLGAMSGSNEIIALKAGGINVVRLIRPVLMLSAICGVATLYLSDRLIPGYQRQFKDMLLGDLESTIQTYLRQKSCIVDERFPYEVYVKAIDDGRLLQPIIKHRRADGAYDMVLQAREATLTIEASRTEPGGMEIVMRLVDGVLSTGPDNTAYFRDRTERMPVPDIINRTQYNLSERSFVELDEQAVDQALVAQQSAARMAMMSAAGVFAAAPSQVADTITKTSGEIAFARSLAFRSRCEKHQRIARASAPIPFALLGCTLSILWRQREALRTFFICFIPVITVYYPLSILAYNLLKESQSPLWSVLWVPGALMVLAAIPFLRRVIRY